MADINLEKKSGPGPWVWVAGLVVLALVVWGVVEFMGDDRTAADERDTTPAAEQYPAEYETQQPLPRTEPYTPPPATDPAVQDPAAPGTTAPPGTTDPGAPGEPGTTNPAGTGNQRR